MVLHVTESLWTVNSCVIKVVVGCVPCLIQKLEERDKGHNLECLINDTNCALNWLLQCQRTGQGQENGNEYREKCHSDDRSPLVIAVVQTRNLQLNLW